MQNATAGSPRAGHDELGVVRAAALHELSRGSVNIFFTTATSLRSSPVALPTAASTLFALLLRMSA